MGFHALLQGIFHTQGSNLHLYVSSTGRQILYHGAIMPQMLGKELFNNKVPLPRLLVPFPTSFWPLAVILL